MYPRNAASPERISLGPVVQIADGVVQVAGVSVSVLPMGGVSGAGTGTIAYENGVVVYTPVQAETNYTSVVFVAYKTGCFPAHQTIVFSSAATVGQVDVGEIEGVDATDAIQAAAAAAITAAVVDTGITLPKALEMLAAFMAGKVTASSAGGVTTYTYKKRDGSTTSFTAACDEADGTRATTGSLS